MASALIDLEGIKLYPRMYVSEGGEPEHIMPLLHQFSFAGGLGNGPATLDKLYEALSQAPKVMEGKGRTADFLYIVKTGPLGDLKIDIPGYTYLFDQKTMTVTYAKEGERMMPPKTDNDLEDYNPNDPDEYSPEPVQQAQEQAPEPRPIDVVKFIAHEDGYKLSIRKGIVYMVLPKEKGNAISGTTLLDLFSYQVVGDIEQLYIYRSERTGEMVLEFPIVKA